MSEIRAFLDNNKDLPTLKIDFDELEETEKSININIGKTIQKSNKMYKANINWEGWNRVVETNGQFREWDNDRIIEGYMTGQAEDSQNDTVHISAFLLDKTADGMTRIEWVAKNAEISLVHGLTPMKILFQHW